MRPQHWLPGGDKKDPIPTMQDVDRRNTKRMKQIIAKHGWPSRSMVANDGARAAWLLVQHADHDAAYQRKCLTLMKAVAADAHENRQDIAYLTDRVLVNEGKPQVYGTQFHVSGGMQQPRPIRDAEDVDKRRESMGLSTLKEYTELMHT